MRENEELSTSMMLPKIQCIANKRRGGKDRLLLRAVISTCSLSMAQRYMINIRRCKPNGEPNGGGKDS